MTLIWTSRWEGWELTWQWRADNGFFSAIPQHGNYICSIWPRFKYPKMSSVCIWLHAPMPLAHPASHMWIELEVFDCTHAQMKLCADTAPFDRAQEHVPQGRSIWVTLFSRHEHPLICGYRQTPPDPLDLSVPFNAALNQQIKSKL